MEMEPTVDIELLDCADGVDPDDAYKWIEDSDDEENSDGMNDTCDLKLSKLDQSGISGRGYKCGKLIGTGTVANVYRAKMYKYTCAIKAIVGKDVQVNELKIQKQIKHPHVVQLFDLYVTCDRSMLIFMELLQGGSMESYLVELKMSKKSLSEKQVRDFYLQFGDALRYIHGLGFAHRDMNAGNVLLDGSKQVCKIADLGDCKQFYDPASGEINDEELRRTDIFHVGILMRAMLEGNKSLTWQGEQLVKLHLQAFEFATTFDKILTTEPWFKMAL